MHLLNGYRDLVPSPRRLRRYRLDLGTKNIWGKMLQKRVFTIIIQQIVTLSKYGHDSLNICNSR